MVKMVILKAMEHLQQEMVVLEQVEVVVEQVEQVDHLMPYQVQVVQAVVAPIQTQAQLVVLVLLIRVLQAAKVHQTMLLAVVAVRVQLAAMELKAQMSAVLAALV